jgi:hypothetical protein
MSKTMVVLFALFLLNVSNAQAIGEIFDMEYADQEFDSVMSFIEIENADLVKMLNTSGEYIMLNIETGTIRAIDAQRKSIQGSAVSNEEIFYKMSTSKVELLLKKGADKITRLEMRPKTMTLTNGDFTLERTDPCPPYCN